jgi:hypothetical protein
MTGDGHSLSRSLLWLWVGGGSDRKCHSQPNKSSAPANRQLTESQRFLSFLPSPPAGSRRRCIARTRSCCLTWGLRTEESGSGTLVRWTTQIAGCKLFFIWLYWLFRLRHVLQLYTCTGTHLSPFLRLQPNGFRELSGLLWAQSKLSTKRFSRSDQP